MVRLFKLSWCGGYICYLSRAGVSKRRRNVNDKSKCVRPLTVISWRGFDSSGVGKRRSLSSVQEEKRRLEPRLKVDESP